MLYSGWLSNLDSMPSRRHTKSLSINSAYINGFIIGSFSYPIDVKAVLVTRVTLFATRPTIAVSAANIMAVAFIGMLARYMVMRFTGYPAIPYFSIRRVLTATDTHETTHHHGLNSILD
jgi:hypothetical protein